MRLLAEHRTTLGATELRAQVSGQGEELARLGLRLAVEDADPQRVLAWFEECRASAIRLRPVRPPDDETIAAELAELRRVASLAQAEGLPASLPATSGAASQARGVDQAAYRRAPGGAEVSVHARSAAEIGAMLGDRALIAYFDLDGALHAVTVVGAGRSSTGSARQRRRGRARCAPFLPAAARTADEPGPVRARRCTPLRCAADASTRHCCGRWRRRRRATARRRADRQPARDAVGDRAQPRRPGVTVAAVGRLVGRRRGAAARARRPLERAAVTVGPGLPFARRGRGRGRPLRRRRALVRPGGDRPEVLARSRPPTLPISPPTARSGPTTRSSPRSRSPTAR